MSCSCSANKGFSAALPIKNYSPWLTPSFTVISSETEHGPFISNTINSIIIERRLKIRVQYL